MFTMHASISIRLGKDQNNRLRWYLRPFESTQKVPYFFQRTNQQNNIINRKTDFTERV